MNAMTLTAKHDYFIFKAELRDKAIDQGDMTDTRLQGLYQRYVMGNAPEWVMAIMDALPVDTKIDKPIVEVKPNLSGKRIGRIQKAERIMLDLLSDQPIEGRFLIDAVVDCGAFHLPALKARVNLIRSGRINLVSYMIYQKHAGHISYIYCLPDQVDKAKEMAAKIEIEALKETRKTVLDALSDQPMKASDLAAIAGVSSAKNLDQFVRPLVERGMVISIKDACAVNNRKCAGYVLGDAK